MAGVVGPEVSAVVVSWNTRELLRACLESFAPEVEAGDAPLTLVQARAIGLMTMIDSGKKDHKILAVAMNDPEYNAYTEAAQMPPHRATMLRRFFQDYKQLEGKAVEVDEMQPAAAAYPVIEDALSRYSAERRRGFK